MDSSFEQVVASYHRARGSGELFDTFYKLFLAKSPDIPPMFSHTDFPHQKLMLRESILELLLFAQTGAGRDVLDKLAQRHRRLHVTCTHYDLWLDALCESLAIHDPEFNLTLAKLWREAMRRGIEIMATSEDSHA